jgi:hypothetical protein
VSTKFSLQLWDLRRQIDKLVDYIKLKIEQKDWHGVSDAANDIRELEAKIETYKELENA